MPDIKETMAIIEATPDDQAILLEGKHGIGKSECVRTYFEGKGYRVVTKFLGQLADAGDLIGLPRHTEDPESGVVHTDFAPPTWWPMTMEENVILFLDELNRGKPEVMQCIMDMVLNRRLNDRKLPTKCRIIAAMNPVSDDGYYEVEELDPALLDRFNRYDFLPSVNEWLDWATKAKCHKFVIGFIAKHPNHLDPETSAKAGAERNTIQASRRSWKRVSDILNKNPNLNVHTMRDTFLGILGPKSTSVFTKYVKEEGKGLDAAKVILKYSKTIENTLKSLDIQTVTQLNREIAIWFKEQEKDIKLSKQLGANTTKNLQKYLNTIQPEAMAEFFDLLSRSNTDGETWPQTLLNLNPNLAEKFFKIVHGEKIEDKQTDDEWDD